jgi:SPFH domain / Band 7 family
MNSKVIKGFVLATVLSLLTSACSLTETPVWIDPGNIGVHVKYSDKNADGTPKVEVVYAGNRLWVNTWYNAYGVYNNATQTSVFKSSDFKAPIEGFEPGVDCKDSDDNGVTLNMNVRWETNPDTIWKLVDNFRENNVAIPLRGANATDGNDLENKLLKRDVEVSACRVAYKYNGIEMRTKAVELGNAILKEVYPKLEANGLKVLSIDIGAIHLDDTLDEQVRQNTRQTVEANKLKFERDQKIANLDAQRKVSAGQAEIDAAYIAEIVKVFDGDKCAAAVYIASRQSNIQHLEFSCPKE